MPNRRAIAIACRLNHPPPDCVSLTHRARFEGVEPGFDVCVTDRPDAAAAYADAGVEVRFGDNPRPGPTAAPTTDTDTDA